LATYLTLLKKSLHCNDFGGELKEIHSPYGVIKRKTLRRSSVY
jgi:hypothetical protein